MHLLIFSESWSLYACIDFFWFFHFNIFKSISFWIDSFFHISSVCNSTILSKCLWWSMTIEKKHMCYKCRFMPSGNTLVLLQMVNQFHFVPIMILGRSSPPLRMLYMTKHILLNYALIWIQLGQHFFCWMYHKFTQRTFMFHLLVHTTVKESYHATEISKHFTLSHLPA